MNKTFNVAFIVSGLLLLIFNSAIHSQEVVNNSDKSLNPEAGRVLRLEKVFEIKDEPGEFYFRWPNSLLLDSQENLSVLDEDQLLKFSPEGTFVRNLYKKGQGPGEISTRYQMVSYFIHQDELFVYDGVAKILHFGGDGKLIKEITQTAGRFSELLGMSDDGFYMRYQTPALQGNPDFREIDNQIHLLSLDGSSAEKILGFTSKIYSGPNFGMDWDKYSHLFNPNDGSLYVTHTCEYQIVKADLKLGKKIVSFNRDYPRVKFVIPEGSESFYEKFNPPKKKFENDVLGMYLNNNNLWVKTSTVDKDKGILFDVFDPQGRYLDSFYLNINGDLELADGDHIFITERDEEENISIKKLKILNSS